MCIYFPMYRSVMGIFFKWEKHLFNHIILQRELRYLPKFTQLYTESLHIIKCNGLFRCVPLDMCNHFGMFLNLLAHPHFALVYPCPLPPLPVHPPFLSHFLYTNNTLTSKQINQYFHLLLFLASITLKSTPCLVPTLISLLKLPCMVSMSLGGR